MARTTQVHPQFDVYALSIQHAKQALAAKRKEFLADEALRWARFSAVQQATLAARVQEFSDAGANVTTLCKAYGTSDRGTILRMLNPASDPPEPTHAPAEPALEPEPEPEPSPYEVTNTDPKAFTVLETATGHALVFDVQVPPARIVRADAASQGFKIDVKNDPTHPVWALLPIAPEA